MVAHDSKSDLPLGKSNQCFLHRDSEVREAVQLLSMVGQRKYDFELREAIKKRTEHFFSPALFYFRDPRPEKWQGDSRV